MVFDVFGEWKQFSQHSFSFPWYTVPRLEDIPIKAFPEKCQPLIDPCHMVEEAESLHEKYRAAFEKLEELWWDLLSSSCR